MTVADNALVIRAERSRARDGKKPSAKVIAEHGHEEPIWPGQHAERLR